MLFLALAGAQASDDQANQKSGGKQAEVCPTFGTKVEFVSSPSEAARQALKQEKLVLVLHVSGNFEDPDFT